MRRYAKYLISFLVLLASAWLILLRAQYASPLAVNKWSPTASLSTGRADACSALLPDGTILVAGGNVGAGATNTVELFNSKGIFMTAPAMQQARAGAACVTLQDGRVLVTGGSDATGPLSTAEIFDAAANTWTAIAPMSHARTGHTATLLPWGAVLIAGGEGAGSVELYRTNEVFTDAGTLSAVRQNYAVVPLPGRRVLFLGGTDGNSVLTSIDMFTADDNSIQVAGQMLTARSSFGAAALPDGTILITGGYDASGNILKTTEIFDPTKGSSIAGPEMAIARAGHQAYALPGNGSVLLVGGTDGATTLTDTEIYGSSTGTFTTAAPMNTARTGAATAMMQRGGLIVAGGRNSSGIVSGSEAYGFATMTSVKSDYQPGQVASMTGTGWTPGETVQVKVTALPADAHSVEFTGVGTADSNGNVQIGGFQIDKSHAGMRFLLTATGAHSTAQSTFTDDTVAIAITGISPVSGTLTGSGSPTITTQVTDVTAPATFPPGSVYIVIDGAAVTSQVLDGTTDANTFLPGVATTMAAGTHHIFAEYPLNGAYTYASSTVQEYIVNAITSQLTTSLSAGTGVAFNTANLLTATVQQSGGGGPIATGTVTFTDTTFSPYTTLGTITLKTGGTCGAVACAIIDVSDTLPRTAGHDILAVYNPDSLSSYGTAQATTNLVTTKINPSFTISAPSTVIDGVPFSATVTANPVYGAITPGLTFLPTQTVTLNGLSNASQNLVGGTTTFSQVVLTGTGSQNLEAVLNSGDPIFNPGAFGTITAVTVSKATPTVTVSYTPSNSISSGQTVTYTATVTKPAGDTNDLTGTVTFADGTNSSGAIGTLNATTTSISYTTAVAPAYQATPHVVTVTYNGDANYNSVVNNSTSLTVLPDTTTTAVTVANQSVGIGASDTYTATVTLSPNVTSPTGTVAFYDNGTVIPGCTALALNGATNPGNTTSFPCVVTGLTNVPNATHNITAIYTSTNTPAGSVSGSTSGIQTVTVTKGTVALSNLSQGSSTYAYGAVNSYSVIVTGSLSTVIPQTEVQFYDNGNPIGTLQAPATNGGTVTISNILLPAGTHNISATFLGDSNYDATGTPISGVTTTVTKATPAFTATGFPINATYAGAIPGPVYPALQIANASGAVGVVPATGSFTVFQGSTQIGGAFTLSGTPASGSISGTLPATIGFGNSLPLTITYSGDSNYLSGTVSPNPVLNVAKAGTTSVLTSNGSPVAAGATVTFTLTVTSATGGTPTGTVTFYDGGTSIGTGTLTGNGISPAAAFQTALLAPGSHSITAVYSGDANFNAPVTTAATTQVINAASTTVAVTPSTYTPTIGQTVTFNFTVTPSASSSPAPTGTVTIYDNTYSASVCSTSTLTVTTGNVVSGSCTKLYDGTAGVGQGGSHSLTAQFVSSNSAQVTSANSPAITESVALTATSISAVTSTATASFTLGASTTLGTIVTPSTGTYSPALANSQTVVFYDGTQTIGRATPFATTGVATLSYTFLTAGTHNITAQFIGDTNYQQSAVSAPPTAIVVATYAATMSVASGTPATSQVFGTTLNLPVTVTGLGGSFPAPTGTITVTATSGVTKTVGTGTLTNGSVTINVPLTAAKFAAGTYSMSVTYSGDSNYAAPAATTWSLQVTAATTTPTYTATYLAANGQNLPLGSGAAVVYGDQVAVTVTLPGSGGATPTGTITFTDGNGNPIGCGGIAISPAGTATCTFAAKSPIFGQSGTAVVAPQSITVKSLSDTNFALPGTVPAFPFIINQANTSVVVTSSLNPSKPGDSVTLSATVSVSAPGSDTLGTGGQTVTFYNASTPIAACSNLAINTSGQTVPACTYAFTTAGNYNITAVFSGDANLAGSISALVVQSVGKPQPTITLTTSNGTTTFGTAVTFTSTVTGTNGITPTGQIQFSDGVNILGTVAVAAITPAGTGSASLTVPASSSGTPLALGAHAITATYIPNGDPNYATITSSSLNQSVSGANATITPVSFNVNPAVFGQPVTLTTTVTPTQSASNALPTGTVTFYDAGTQIGSAVTLASVGGVMTAQLTGATLTPTGTHGSITAKYSGDSNFASITSAVSSLQVNPASTTIAASVSPASYSYGATMVLSAAVSIVSPGAAVGSTGLVGTVSFYDGAVAAGNLICKSTAVVGGGASCTATAGSGLTASPLIGSHNIIAVYNGGGSNDPNFAASTSAPFAISVTKTNTTTTVTSTGSPIVTGQTVTFTATVTPAAGAYTSALTGTVAFSSNGVPLGTGNVNVSGGVATASLTVPSTGIAALVGTLAGSTYTITANYSGDTNYNSSTTASGFAEVVNRAATTTVLSTSTNSAVVGQTVTLTAIVTVNAPGTGTPTGTVVFNNTLNNLPTAICAGVQLNPAAGANAANQFIATCTPVTNLPQGSLSVTATYSGDSAYVGSTSPAITQIVSKTSVTVALLASNNPILYGTPVTFTGTVSAVPPASNQTGPTITGTATWYDGITYLGTSAIGGGGVTTFTVPLLAVGTHSIAMQYGGDGNYAGVISESISEIVTKQPSAISLTSNAVNAVASQVVTFTAQITPFPPAGVAYPTGQVVFLDGSTQIGVGQLSSGVATVSTAGLTPGLHYISASYAGDTNWSSAVSTYVQQSITVAQTTTQVVSSANPSVWGQPVVFTVSTTVAFPGTVPANGSVQLYDNTVALGSAASIANGTVSITVPSLSIGTHNIIATYIGNSSFATSNSAPVSQLVNKAPTTTMLAVLPGSSTSNAQVTLTAVVSVPSPGAGTPTGTVQFINATANGSVLGTAALTSVGGVYTATITTSQLNQATSAQLLTAVYSGDTSFATSTSPAQSETVFGTTIAMTNAAGYTTTNFAPDSAAAIFVSNIVSTTLAATTLPLPTSLSGVTVTVTDSASVARLAQLYFVSPTQINFLVPTNTAFGLATITVTNASGQTASGIVLITHTAPGLFSAAASGQGVAAAQFIDVAPSGAQTASSVAQYNAATASWTAAPLTMNSTDTYILQLYGTGIRYASSGTVTATINGVTATVEYAGAQPQYPGLDQVNLLIPSSLKGAGQVPVVIAVAGQASNTVTIAIN